MGRPVSFKWAFPFLPMLMFAYPPPVEASERWLRVAGVLILTATLLLVIRPWERSERAS